MKYTRLTTFVIVSFCYIFLFAAHVTEAAVAKTGNIFVQSIIDRNPRNPNEPLRILLKLDKYIGVSTTTGTTTSRLFKNLELKETQRIYVTDFANYDIKVGTCLPTTAKGNCVVKTFPITPSCSKGLCSISKSDLKITDLIATGRSRKIVFNYTYRKGNDPLLEVRAYPTRPFGPAPHSVGFNINIVSSIPYTLLSYDVSCADNGVVNYSGIFASTTVTTPMNVCVFTGTGVRSTRVTVRGAGVVAATNADVIVRTQTQLPNLPVRKPATN